MRLLHKLLLRPAVEKDFQSRQRSSSVTIKVRRRNNMKSQKIGCKVESCQYHQKDCTCGLERIEVQPCPGCGNGQAREETLCGSYECRCGE